MKKSFKSIANLLCVVLSILLLIAMLILCIIEIYSYFTCKAVININEAWSCVFSGIIGSLLSCLCVLIGFSITDRSKKIDNQLKLREMFSQELRWEVHRTLETEDISYWENKSGSKSVLLLQKVYKFRYKMMNIKAKKIQQYYRQKKAEKVERDKLILKKKLEIQKEKYKYLDVDKIMKKVLKNKDDKDIHDMALNLGDEVNEINKRKKNEKKIVDVTNDLINEQNPENIVDLLLYSQLPGETKPNRKQIKRSKSDIFRIEDRLIYEGKLQKQKREKLEKIKRN